MYTPSEEGIMFSEIAPKFTDTPLVPLDPLGPEVPLVPLDPLGPEVPLVPLDPLVPLVPLPPPPVPPDRYGKLFQEVDPFPIFNLPVSNSNPASPAYNVGFIDAQFAAVSLFNWILEILMVAILYKYY